MSSKNGWVKIYRDITKHWVFDDPLLFKIWLDIVLSANHEPKKFSIKNDLIEVQRGQFWTSIRKLAVRWGIDKDTVSKKLNLLQSDGMIFVDSQPRKGTMITVRNYGVYQDFSDDDTDSLSDKDSDKDSDKKSYKEQTKNRTKNRHEQEYKNDIRMNKKEKNSGLTPDDPDYFEEY